MQNLIIEPFKVIGIAIKTTNENGQAATDIGELWNKFMKQSIVNTIPNKIDTTIYAIYTDYESDHTKPYTTLLGCKVEHLNTIPDGMIGKTIEGGKYLKITTKGDITKGLIANEWMKIWQSDLNRRYTADYEVYGEKAQNPTDAEVDILIAIK